MPIEGVFDYDEGISAIDSVYDRRLQTAIHLIVEKGRAAIVDTGTANAVPYVMKALEAKGIAPEAVDYVILTHVHLDHAGGAGSLMARFPGARLTVHPRGARHMIDPGRLVAATVEIYGEEAMRRTYGEVLPVPKERVIETPEGARLELAGRELLFLDAPGHARHHVVVRDSRTGHFFVGDNFGLSYRELDRDGRQFVFPTSSPSQFDPPVLLRTIERMLSDGPQAIYLAHFGRLTAPQALAADLRRLIEAHAALAERHKDAGAERKRLLAEGVRSLVLEEKSRQGWRIADEKLLEVFALDIELNAQGLVSWLDSRGKN
ncbi:MAG TPA: MBL fold metallo-hydrolase [Burkholderiales bacterium]|jgi:hydroxyacylglutathione hydrolase|nr:MBL fold metallo-hydrolase [Burkholderiales bacterium]